MSAQRSQHAPTTGPAAGSGGPRRARGTAAHSLRIGRLLGVPLQVHWSFLFLLALVVAAEWSAGTGAIVGGLVWVAALFACVVAHELAHCIVARRRGGRVLGILLLPIGGMSRMEQIPSSPSDEAAIAAVGPATSLLLGGLFLAVGAALGSAVWPPTLVTGSWWARLGWMNLLLAAFNLLPALPMDGGRVLRAALSRRLSRPTATRAAATVAHLLAIALIVAGVFYDFLLVVIGVFVFFGASREVAVARAEDLATGPPAGVWWHGWYSGPGPRPRWYPPPPGSGPGWYPPPPAPPATTPPALPAMTPPPAHGEWPPPWGKEPSPRLPVDVAVERRRADPGGREPLGEGCGEHD